MTDQNRRTDAPPTLSRLGREWRLWLDETIAEA